MHLQDASFDWVKMLLDMCMARYQIAFLAVTAALAIGSGFCFGRGEIINLHAEQTLPIARSPIEPASGTNLVYVMRLGEEAEVLGCEDIKSDLVIRVRVATGDSGYVSSGQYTLARGSVTAHQLFTDPRRIAFSCNGFFLHRSRDSGSE